MLTFEDQRAATDGEVSDEQLSDILTSAEGEAAGIEFFVQKLKDTYPFYNRRLKIRPGVSGWAQINQPFDTSIKDVHQKLKYDFYYIHFF